jgi:hypothetical protein
MKEIRQRVRVREDGRLEITDPALVAGTEADVVVRVPEGDGAAGGAPPHPETRMLTLEELDALPPLPLDQILGAAPSGRGADEVDRDLRALRDEWERPWWDREE